MLEIKNQEEAVRDPSLCPHCGAKLSMDIGSATFGWTYKECDCQTKKEEK
ncbi:MAG TPA: hypothetical protein VJK25_03500 [Patescibacteria group bacterium]|nr:hypothetical protein [Patescibacteria group bacterium]